MYNERLKMDFLIENGKASSPHLQSNFDVAEKFESKYKTDICCFTKKMLEELFSQRYGISRRKREVLQLFIQYHDYCRDRGIRVCDDIYDFDVDYISSTRRSMVANPLHLERLLDNCLRPVSECGTDNIVRCYFELAYLGFTKEESASIADTDVDFDSMMITFKDPGVIIPSEFYPNIRFCTKATEAYEYRPNESKPRVYGRPPHGRLLRTTKDLKLTALHSMQSKRLKNTDVNITYDTVATSGKFYRKYQESLAYGVPVDFDDEVRDWIRANQTDTSDMAAVRKAAVRFKHDLQVSYDNWKKAFYE